MIIGITGGTGSGKTTALKVLENFGAVVLDCDAIYHELLKTDPSLLLAIENRFPGTVENGALHRKKLGAIVFADQDALKDLNAITHGAVKKEVERRLDGNLTVIDAIGLFESGLNALCDLTIAIIAPTEDRIARLMARDGISREYALSRIQAQPSDEEFTQRCDYILVNNETQHAFQEKCLAFFRQWDIIRENQ